MRLDEDYVEDILTAAKKIARRIEHLTREQFLADDVLQDAILHQL
jgi:uncharacterized protein with HEPN domain